MNTTTLRRRGAGLAIAAVLAVGACGAPATPELTSPTEIALAMLASTETAKSVHVELTVTGELKIAVVAGGPTTDVDLSGSTASADLDLANAAAHATFAAPNLFNLGGDLIALDGQAYVKTTIGGPKYGVSPLGDTLPIDITSAKGFADTLGDFLMSDTITLKKGDDAACGPKRCYAVSAPVTAEDLASMLGGVQLPAGLPFDLSGAALDVQVRVEKDLPNHLGGLTITVAPAEGDPLTLDLTFSKWDESVTITAPPADQIAAG